MVSLNNAVYIAISVGKPGVNTRILPVTPSLINIGRPQNNRRDVIINIGEIADIGKSMPEMISFSSFFPALNDTYVQIASNPELREGLYSPESWLQYFGSLEQKKLHVIISTMAVGGLYLLDDFRLKKIGGTGGDIDYDVRFVKYTPIFIKKVDIDSEVAIEISNTRNIQAESIRNNQYIVKLNDTWSSIANKFRVTALELRQINNRINLYDLVVGDVLAIPPISAARYVSEDNYLFGIG